MSENYFELYLQSCIQDCRYSSFFWNNSYLFIFIISKFMAFWNNSFYSFAFIISKFLKFIVHINLSKSSHYQLVKIIIKDKNVVLKITYIIYIFMSSMLSRNSFILGITEAIVPFIKGFFKLASFDSSRKGLLPPSLHKCKYSFQAFSLFSFDLIQNWKAHTCASV